SITCSGRYYQKWSKERVEVNRPGACSSLTWRTHGTRLHYGKKQSQLSHYPERKIAEFQLSIQGLEQEYQRFVCKLRALDPTCKHQPWTPRAYTKRRADTHTCLITAKKRLSLQSCDLSSTVGGNEWNCVNERTGIDATSASDKQRNLQQTGMLLHPFPVGWTNAYPVDSESTRPTQDQDQPLTFDRTRLEVAVAGSRGPVQPGSSHTQSLARVLLSGLPNLHSSPLGQAIAAQNQCSTGREGLDCAGTEVIHCVVKDEERTGHVVELCCYSSSDEEENT
uniref:Uncharacterized protein n=1 Tax=Esox lucius TaxID=8010 RepID=A0AAY5K085_ESOLU